jgi:hypothetical protein
MNVLLLSALLVAAAPSSFDAGVAQAGAAAVPGEQERVDAVHVAAAAAIGATAGVLVGAASGGGVGVLVGQSVFADQGFGYETFSIAFGMSIGALVLGAAGAATGTAVAMGDVWLAPTALAGLGGGVGTAALALPAAGMALNLLSVLYSPFFCVLSPFCGIAGAVGGIACGAYGIHLVGEANADRVTPRRAVDGAGKPLPRAEQPPRQTTPTPPTPPTDPAESGAPPEAPAASPDGQGAPPGTGL